MSNSIFKILPLGLLGAVYLSLTSIGEAKAFTFAEPPDSGPVLINAADTTALGAVGPSSTIDGFIAADNPNVSPDRNKADLFKILIDVDGTFTAATEGRSGSVRNPLIPIEDPYIYLFDSTGLLITSDDDSGPAFQDFITQFLTAGNYYLGITKYGHAPTFDADNILTGWSGDFGEFSVSDTENRSAYRINLTHTPAVAVPTPALLPGLLGMGLSLWRKRKEEALV